MCNDASSFIFEHLSTTDMVPMVVTVEQILDGSICDVSDLSQHVLGMLVIHGVNHHDTLLGHNEHGVGDAIVSEGIHIRCHLSGLWLPQEETLPLNQ